VGPNKRRHELLLQVVGLLQLEELLGELVQLADLPVAPGIHRRQPSVGIGRAQGGKQPCQLLKQRRVLMSAHQSQPRHRLWGPLAKRLYPCLEPAVADQPGQDPGQAGRLFLGRQRVECGVVVQVIQQALDRPLDQVLVLVLDPHSMTRAPGTSPRAPWPANTRRFQGLS